MKPKPRRDVAGSARALFTVLCHALDWLEQEARKDGVLPEHARLELRDVEVYSWPQTWGDTACGFGGYGGQTITTRQTCVVISSYYTETALVYHAGRFAYAVKRPGDEFWSAFAARRLPGKADWHAHLSRPDHGR